MSSCKAVVRPEQAALADKVKTAAFALGDLLGGHHGDAYRHRVAAAQMAMMAPVLAEVARLAGEIAALKGGSFSEQMHAAAEQTRSYVEAREVRVGDRFEVVHGEHAGDVATVVGVAVGCSDLVYCDGPNGLAMGWEADDLLDRLRFKRLPREPEGVKVGDTFRWKGGVHDGEIGEVVDGPFGSDRRWSFVTGRSSAELSTNELTNVHQFERVRAVEAPRAYEPDGNERLATAEELARPIDATGVGLGGFAPAADSAGAAGGLTGAATDLGDSLDGPAGDELPFAEQREDRRAQAHAACVAAAGWRKDVQALMKARDAHAESDDAWVALTRAVDALARRAGLL
jgi:hypothetical protein